MKSEAAIEIVDDGVAAGTGEETIEEIPEIAVGIVEGTAVVIETGLETEEAGGETPREVEIGRGQGIAPQVEDIKDLQEVA